ncbi:formylglycine-generating enzyme family protein [Leisingera sp. S232]|uniref:formylglycine-generating enzyme family protein n=1 Tax=Leisingera sp. S232 TaxID=3415132 RepID=UPI003C7A0E8E
MPEGVTWRDRIYNPVPAADDVILPMNCGGAMVFRKVMTPNTGGAAGDVPVILGQQGSDQPYLDGLRRSYVSGGFTSENGSAYGFFYMAKYELSQGQLDVAFVDDPADCPRKISRKGRLPAVGVTKSQLDQFAERYTIWLMQNAPEFLPHEGDTMGFLRLPTEEEWEFAARGGLSVAEAEFRAGRPPIPDGESYSEYIAHGGSDSASGEVQSIGTLKPNQLGLHDMLGNAWEIVGSPFALVRHGRLHGQAGGIVRRGGGANWPLTEITSAQRFEMAPYNARRLDAQADRYTGARFVMSAISITSEDQRRALVEELDKLARPDPASASARSEEEVRSLLKRMQKQAITEQERGQLQIVSDMLAAATAERNAHRDKALRLILTSSVLLCNQAVQRYLTASLANQTVLSDLENLEQDARAAGDQAFLSEVLEAKEEARSALARLGDSLKRDVVEYANLIEGVASDNSMEAIREQAEFIREGQMGLSERRDACYGILRTHLETRFALGAADIAAMRDDFQTIAIAIQKQ